MEGIEIYGGDPLSGEVRIQGSKNAALPILAAVILHRGITKLHNCPNIRDVTYMVQILEEMGCHVTWSGHTLCVDAKEVHSAWVSPEAGKKMRSSIIFLGALLGRMKEACIPYPGGCVIGARPIDLHKKSMEQMQTSFEEKDGIVYASAPNLLGSSIPLDFPSVGATENIILAAVLAEGRTEILNAAKEPEIVELCEFLNQKGAKITGAGTACIVIEGVSELADSEYCLMSDRIVAGTYLMAVMATRGQCVLKAAPVSQLTKVLEMVQKMGAVITVKAEELSVDGRVASQPLPFAETLPYPGFPTDLQSQLMALLSVAEGESRIAERMFESRFKIAAELRRMGAGIVIAGAEARISGGALLGTAVNAPELRGGAALVIAGLCATGKTTIADCHYIERGYEDICGDLQKLGAQIRKIDR